MRYNCEPLQVKPFGMTAAAAAVPGPVTFELDALFRGPWALTLDPGGAKGGYAAGVLSGLFRRYKNALATLQLICGCSVGSIIAAKVAMHVADPHGGHLRDVPRIYRKVRRADLLGPLSPLLDTAGRLLGEHGNVVGNIVASRLQLDQFGRLPIVDLAEQYLPDSAWKKLFEHAAKHPAFDLSIVVTQLGSGQVRLVCLRDCQDPAYFRRAVLASAAIPGLFPAVQIEDGGPRYIDGGVASLDPVHLMAVAGRLRHVAGLLAIHYAPYVPGVATGVPHAASTLLGMLVGTMAAKKKEKPKPQPRQYGWCCSDGRNIPCIHVSPSSPLRLDVLDFDQPKMGRAVDKGVRDARELK